MRNIVENFSNILTNAAIDGLFIDAPTGASLSYVFREEAFSAKGFFTSAAIAALAYSIRNIARGRLQDIGQDRPVPLWGAIAGALKYGIRYSLKHRDDFNTSSFLYTCGRGALNVFLYESHREQIGNIIANDEVSTVIKTLDLGFIFSVFEGMDSILSSDRISMSSIFSGIATGFVTSAFVMISENAPLQDKLLMIAASSALYSINQNPYDIVFNVAVAYTLNKITSSFVDMLYKEQEAVLAR